MKRLPPEAALFGIPPNSSPPSLPVGPQNVIQNVLQIRRPRKHIIDFAAENRTKKLVRFPLGAPRLSKIKSLRWVVSPKVSRMFSCGLANL